MSVVLLSDRSGQRTSDEHTAFDLSAGRTLLPMSQADRQNRDAPVDPPEPLPPMPPPPPSIGGDARDEPPRRDLPWSTYVHASG